MRTKLEFEWNILEDANQGRLLTHRAKVISGWLIRTIVQDLRRNVLSTSIIFIQDKDHEWEIVAPQPDIKAEAEEISKHF